MKRATLIVDPALIAEVLKLPPCTIIGARLSGAPCVMMELEIESDQLPDDAKAVIAEITYSAKWRKIG